MIKNLSYIKISEMEFCMIKDCSSRAETSCQKCGNSLCSKCVIAITSKYKRGYFSACPNCKQKLDDEDAQIDSSWFSRLMIYITNSWHYE